MYTMVMIVTCISYPIWRFVFLFFVIHISQAVLEGYIRFDLLLSTWGLELTSASM
jgi:hypothetical protein